MAWTTVNSSPRDIWNYVSRLESYDYAARVHEEFHGSPADHSKIGQINAAFSQGRMYFESAESAALGVKPLLLYYGAMSLATGLVLFKNQSLREESFKPSHGLARHRWKETLGEGINGVLTLQASVTGGTFRELAESAWPWYVTKLYSGDVRKKELYPELLPLGPTKFVHDRSTLSLADLISRSKYTGGDFGSITTDRNRLHRATVRFEYGITFLFDGSIPEGLNLEQRFARESPSIPLFHYGGEAQMSVVEDFPNGDRFSELIKLYLIAYMLGMLARYFPSKWMSLIRNERGSGAQPLLAKAARSIETDFPREFAGEIAVLANEPHFFGEHFGHLAQSFGNDWRNGWREQA